MYEAEVNQPFAAETALPAAIRDAFRNSSRTITGRTVLPWGEHCTECAIPTCYETCDLYVPRKDGKCRRFANGMVRIDHAESLSGYILKIDFKRWAKLWTAGNTRIFPLAEAKALEDHDLAIAQRLGRISHIPLQIHLIRQRYDKKKRGALQPPAGGQDEPDYFLFECYNPSPNPVSVSLVMRPLASARKMAFERLVEMPPAFTHIEVPLVEITSVLNTAEPFGLEIIPNAVEDVLVLYFGTMDFVRDTAFIPHVEPCKVVVWDLDNTLWDGTLAEDGMDKLILRPGIREVLEELDQRGILLSIASKNNAEDALMALRKFGLDEYFLYPQISWSPKSAALLRIAAALNVGLDSMTFIDDSTFERAEVHNACPTVRVIDVTEYRTLPARAEFQVPLTAESSNRKQLYRLQQLRETALDSSQSTYLEFLRDARLELTLTSLSADNIPRVHELTQRTNQMNFSGNRYTRPKLDAIIENPQLDTYVIDCRDRFGIYGTIGFCVLDRQANLVIDLVFSCRIQSKRVEHGFLIYLLQTHRAGGADDFYVSYQRTSRNENASKVFDDLGFEALDDKNGVCVLVFRADRDIPEDNINICVTHDYAKRGRTNDLPAAPSPASC
jgi:FkbH-like protein